MDMQEDKFDVRDAIKVHVDAESEDYGVGLVYTRGMAALGCPELEIRGIPLFLSSQAASLLNHVAQYIVEKQRAGDPVKEGQVMSTGEFSVFRFIQLEPSPGEEEYYAHGRWVLSDDPMHRCHECENCHGSEGHDGEHLN